MKRLIVLSHSSSHALFRPYSVIIYSGHISMAKQLKNDRGKKILHPFDKAVITAAAS